MNNGQEQDVTPIVGEGSNFFNDFFIDQSELDGTTQEEVTDETKEEETDESGEPQDEVQDEESDETPEDEASDEAGSEEQPDDEERGSGDEAETPGDEESDEDSSGGEVESLDLQGLVDNGILDMNPEREYSGGDKGLEELIEDTIAARLSQQEESDPDVAAFKAFKQHNPEGTIEDFYNQQDMPDYSEVDENDPETALYLLEDMYELQGLSQEEIDQNIQEHKTSKSVGRHAKRAKQMLIKWQKDNEQAEAQAQQASRERAEAERVEQRREFEQRVLKSESIGGIPVDPRERQKLADYIMKPVGKSGETQLQMDEAKNENDAALLYAYIKMNNIDLTKLERKAETKATIKFKNSINKHTDRMAKKQKSVKQTSRNAEPDDLSGLDGWTAAQAAR